MTIFSPHISFQFKNKSPSPPQYKQKPLPLPIKVIVCPASIFFNECFRPISSSCLVVAWPWKPSLYAVMKLEAGGYQKKWVWSFGVFKHFSIPFPTKICNSHFPHLPNPPTSQHLPTTAVMSPDTPTKLLSIVCRFLACHSWGICCWSADCVTFSSFC